MVLGESIACETVRLTVMESLAPCGGGEMSVLTGCILAKFAEMR
jgi:hypothetical protein